MVLPEADPDSDLVCRYYLAPGRLTVEVAVRGLRRPRARVRLLRLAGAQHHGHATPRPTRPAAASPSRSPWSPESPEPAADGCLRSPDTPADGSAPGPPRAYPGPIVRGEQAPQRRAVRSRCTADGATPGRHGRRRATSLVHLHLPLVEHCARRFRNRGEPFEDLVQVGTIGLLKSIDRFDTERGVEFSTYATPTIIGEIKRYFRDKGWAIRVPRRLQELRMQIGAATAELTQSLGRSPTPRELADAIGCSVEEIIEGIESSNAYSTLSLDASDDAEDGGGVDARRASASRTRTSSTSRSASRSSRCSTPSSRGRRRSCCCGSSRTRRRPRSPRRSASPRCTSRGC